MIAEATETNGRMGRQADPVTIRSILVTGIARRPSLPMAGFGGAVGKCCAPLEAATEFDQPGPKFPTLADFTRRTGVLGTPEGKGQFFEEFGFDAALR
jgi:hypothetical protein